MRRRAYPSTKLNKKEEPATRVLPLKRNYERIHFQISGSVEFLP